MLKQNNLHIYEELARDDFGASLSGEPFSAIHRDLVIEVTIDMEVKIRDEPHREAIVRQLTPPSTLSSTHTVWLVCEHH